MNLGSLQKIIKCAGNNDTVTLRADESADVLGLMFENNCQFIPTSVLQTDGIAALDRVAEFEMKLMDIDQEHLGIPDTVYDADISLPAVEFARIIRDLKELGESVRIEVSKEGIRFSCEGDIASASVTLKHTTAAAGGDSDEEEEDAEEEDDDEEEEPVQKQKKKKVAAIKDDDEDEEDEVMVVEGEKALFVAGSDDEKDVKPTASSDNDEEDEEAPAKKQKGVLKRKQAAKEKKAVKKVKGDAKGKGKPAKKEDVPKKVTIQLLQTVNLTFSIKYLSNFAKSTPLSDYVTVRLPPPLPLAALI